MSSSASTCSWQVRSEIVGNVNDELGSREAVIDDLDALLKDKNIPLDEVSRRQLAEHIIDEAAHKGALTISNALLWRLQYSRATSASAAKTIAPKVEDLYG